MKAQFSNPIGVFRVAVLPAVVLAACLGGCKSGGPQPAGADAASRLDASSALADAALADASNAGDAASADAAVPDAGAQDGAITPVLTPSQIATNVASDIASTTAFLYTGPGAVQTGVTPGTIDSQRVVVVRGRVLDNLGSALPGVEITIPAHPELGTTHSRADGAYDLAVNGGGALVLSFRLANRIPVQREVRTGWRHFVVVNDVIMLPRDLVMNPVSLASSGMQSARGSTVTDSDGTRQSTLLVPSGTQATLVSSGGPKTLSSLHVRATEYTVGAVGPNSMPAALPPTSAYTYAIDLSADEADEVDGDVQFNQPLIHYVENFLNFPVGTTVPVGYYDRKLSRWIGAPSGLVIKVLSVQGGVAALDLDGDGVAEGPTALAALGVAQAELQQLATLYTAGQSLWRVPIAHFSPWDCNWPYGPPQDAEPPAVPAPHPPPIDDDPDRHCGSDIDCVNQSLGESIPVTGAAFGLHYSSSRHSQVAATLVIPLSGATVPADLKRIDLVITIGGKQFTQTFPAQANQSYTFSWDGMDGYGRLLYGAQPYRTDVGFVYDAVYYTPDSSDPWAKFGGMPISGDRTRQEVTLWQYGTGTLTASYPDSGGIGGWTLTVQNALDPSGQVLLFGDGRSSSQATLQAQVIQTAAGVGSAGSSGDGGPAQKAGVVPYKIAAAPDGSIYLAEGSSHGNPYGNVRRIGRDGVISHFAGDGTDLYSGDGGPATTAGLGPIWSLAVGPDASVYVGTGTGQHSDCRIRRIGADGIIQTVAGTQTLFNGYYESCCSPDGSYPDKPTCAENVAASQTTIGPVESLAVAPDGTIYLTDGFQLRIIGTNGIITTASGVPKGVSDLALGPDGSVYVSHLFGVSRIRPDGSVTLVAGATNYADYSNGTLADGVPATQAKMLISALAIAPNGVLVTADSADSSQPLVRIRVVSQEGMIETVAGPPTATSPWVTGTGDGGPATQARLGSPTGLAFGPDGTLYVSDNGQYRVRKVQSPWSGWGTEGMPGPDGLEAYFFFLDGRHDKTLDALTGAQRWQFTYDTAGLLKTLTDGDGNVTQIERDAAGRPQAIVAPHGQRTTLTVNADGLLKSVTDPLGGQYQLGYDGPSGLLTSFKDPLGNPHTFAYSPWGRLTSDQPPAGASTTLSRTDQVGGYTATLTTPLGHTTTYQLVRDATGEHYTTTGPGGEKTEELRANDESRTATYPDGTVSRVVLAPDPRFGMVAPLDSTTTLTTPAGLTATQTHTRTAMLSDPTNPLSLQSLTDTVTLGGRSFLSHWDASSRTLVTTSAEGRTLTVVVDDHARPLTMTRSGLTPVSFTYDANGRLGTMAQGTRSLSVTYGGDGALATLTDAASRTITLTRDTAGRVTKQALSDGRSIALGRDVAGNLTSFTPPGRTAQLFGYDPQQQLSSWTAPDVGSGPPTTTFTFDADRAPTGLSRADGSQLVVAYDTAGRRASVTMPSGSIGFTYLPDGQLSRITAADGGTTDFTYDGPLLTDVSLGGSLTGTVHRTYGNDLRLASEAVDGENPISFSYDGDGLVTGGGSLVIQRDASTGIIAGTTLGTATDSRTFDGFGAPETITWQVGATSLYQVNVTNRDAPGRITRNEESVLGVVQVYQYGYDAQGRLTDVTIDGTLAAHHDYDSNGNRTGRTVGATVTNGAYDSQDQMTSFGDATYAYGSSGQLTKRTRASGVTTYDYDLLGALLGVTLPGGTRVDYVLDGQERRIGRKVNGTLQRGWLYGAGESPLAELDASHDVTSRFVYGTNRHVPDYMVNGGATYRIVTDLLGSPRLVVDTSTGAIAQRLDYDEMGRVTQDTNPGFQPFGFAGGLYDPDTQLVRLGARDYDPETGRWTAPDPEILGGRQTNLYVYTDDDPINFVDPSGFDDASDIGEEQPGIGGLWDDFKLGVKSWFTDWGKKTLDDTDYGTYKRIEKVANHLTTTLPELRRMESYTSLLNNPNDCDKGVDMLVQRNALQQVVINDTAEAAGRAYETAYTAAVSNGLGNPADAAKDVAVDAVKDAAPGLWSKLWAYLRH